MKYHNTDNKWSKLTPEQWKIILDKEQRRIFGLPEGTEIITTIIKK